MPPWAGFHWRPDHGHYTSDVGPRETTFVSGHHLNCSRQRSMFLHILARNTSDEEGDLMHIRLKGVIALATATGATLGLTAIPTSGQTPSA